MGITHPYGHSYFSLPSERAHGVVRLQEQKWLWLQSHGKEMFYKPEALFCM